MPLPHSEEKDRTGEQSSTSPLHLCKVGWGPAQQAASFSLMEEDNWGQGREASKKAWAMQKCAAGCEFAFPKQHITFHFTCSAVRNCGLTLLELHVARCSMSLTTLLRFKVHFPLFCINFQPPRFKTLGGGKHQNIFTLIIISISFPDINFPHFPLKKMARRK